MFLGTRSKVIHKAGVGFAFWQALARYIGVDPQTGIRAVFQRATGLSHYSFDSNYELQKTPYFATTESFDIALPISK